MALNWPLRARQDCVFVTIDGRLHMHSEARSCRAVVLSDRAGCQLLGAATQQSGVGARQRHECEYSIDRELASLLLF